jgi:transcriptional regulator with XRE-family HTH domain
MQIIKPRYELTNARLLRGWTEADVAERLHPSPSAETVRRWESGTQTPRADIIGQLCKLFRVTHPRELNLDAQFNASITHCREDELIAMLELYDRRQLLSVLSRLSMFAGIDLTALFSTTIVAPEKLLNVCRALIGQCWNLLNRKGEVIADSLLSVCMSELESLATHSSKYQQEAAALVVEAKIIQIKIATHKMDYKRRLSLGSEAVLLGEMSGDENLHVTAIGWHANTYVNCFSQPEVSLAILNNILPRLNDTAPLNRADIYMELAKAHALDEKDMDEGATKARDYIELAHSVMPENPELSPIFRLIDLGKAELNMREGKTYLTLAKRFPTHKEYGQKAHDIFAAASAENFLSAANQSGTLLHRADAARAIGNMDDYLDSLTEGARIVRQIDSHRGIAHAIRILQKAPRGWRNEQRYIELRKIMTPNIFAHR